MQREAGKYMTKSMQSSSGQPFQRWGHSHLSCCVHYVTKSHFSGKQLCLGNDCPLYSENKPPAFKIIRMLPLFLATKRSLYKFILKKKEKIQTCNIQHIKPNNSGIKKNIATQERAIRSEVLAFTLIQGISKMCNENYYIAVQKINENVNSWAPTVFSIPFKKQAFFKL